MHNLPRTMSLAAALAITTTASAKSELASAPAADDVATLRAQGPAGLATLLARFDRLGAGPARDALALRIDAVAAQRYATVSRLYWYTDLGQAEAAARAQHRPILALRMLGRLDEDLSCANSRIFRATLYANADVSKFLRDNFVLYWSSERAVPVVTIDFGDGRKIQRTTTGNSAHYVLDENGGVIDVLPGVYAPTVFKSELTKTLTLAKKLRGLDEARRAVAVAEHAKTGGDQARAEFAKVGGQVYLPGRRRLVAAADVASELAKAQRATMSKARVEVPDLVRIGFDAGAIAPTDVDQWATVGQMAFGIGDVKPVAERAAEPVAQQKQAATAKPVAAPRILDDQSRALVARLHNGDGRPVPQAQLDAMIARLEQTLVADTALNEFQLRAQIRTYLDTARVRDFGKLNEMIYANVFHTPKSDLWLGLHPRTDFTGLPADGVSTPAI
ncbi:MAG: hypothetical protein KIT31_19395 [Deltaproteobacteria bacterium]|nr:hypothetical protein [Deltaproteobacteria bacterium]